MSQFDRLIINPSTKADLKIFMKKPPQALMLTGSPGSGKKTLARELAYLLLGNRSKTNLYLVNRLNQTEISINQIRGIIKELHKKVPGQRSIRRVILIEDAHLMSLEAQNALLKVLEEPNPETVFMLTVINPEAVLGTIASRSQRINVIPITKEQAFQSLSPQFPESDIETNWSLSGGQVGLLWSLLTNDQQSLSKAVQTAKKLLTKNKYERLIMLEELIKSREDFLLLLEALSRILTALQRTSLKSDAVKLQTAKVLTLRKLVAEIERGMNSPISLKLAGLHLILQIAV